MAPSKTFEDQIDELEQRYHSLVKDGQEQLEKMEDRYNEVIDRMEKQLPDDAADLLKRLRKANADFRKQMAKLREQARDATREMIDAIKDAGDRMPSGQGAKKKTSKKAGKKPAKKKATAKKAAKKPAKKSPKKAAAKAPSASWTKAELYDEATRLEVSGRSKMSKQQLLNAVRKAG